MSELIKRYSNGEITVIWKPSRCIHSEICAKSLPDVFNPENRPWINPQASDTKTIKQQIDQCPSAALSYESESAADKPISRVEITVSANGPLLIKGPVLVTDTGGRTEAREKITALCRCGASSNKPYCDGSHKNIGFTDEQGNIPPDNIFD